MELSAAGGVSNRVAKFCEIGGMKKGDRVAGVLSRRPETVAIMIGVWKIGAIDVPNFTGFGPEAVGAECADVKPRFSFVHEEYRDRFYQRCTIRSK